MTNDEKILRATIVGAFMVLYALLMGLLSIILGGHYDAAEISVKLWILAQTVTIGYAVKSTLGLIWSWILETKIVPGPILWDDAGIFLSSRTWASRHNAELGKMFAYFREARRRDAAEN